MPSYTSSNAQAVFGKLTPDVMLFTILYSIAGLGIAIVNDFKSIEGDRYSSSVKTRYHINSLQGDGIAVTPSSIWCGHSKVDLRWQRRCDATLCGCLPLLWFGHKDEHFYLVGSDSATDLFPVQVLSARSNS